MAIELLFFQNRLLNLLSFIAFGVFFSVRKFASNGMFTELSVFFSIIVGFTECYENIGGGGGGSYAPTPHSPSVRH